jgi:hypothetical protein
MRVTVLYQSAGAKPNSLNNPHRQGLFSPLGRGAAQRTSALGRGQRPGHEPRLQQFAHRREEAPVLGGGTDRHAHPTFAPQRRARTDKHAPLRQPAHQVGLGR